MKIKNLLISILLFILTFSLWSFDLSLANLYEYSPSGNAFTEKNITEDLLRSLRVADKEGILSFSKTKSKDIPKSILDTAALSEFEDIDFIVYGFLKVEEDYYDLEIKLYDRDAGGIKTVFYSKNSIDNYEKLIQTMTDQIVTYFYKTLGVIRKKEELIKENGVIDLEFGLGCWFPFEPWAQSLMGLVSTRINTSITPVDTLFKWNIFSVTLGYGIGINYSLGMNKEGYESYFFHSIRFGFPVSLSAIWHKRNKIVFQIAPELQLDILEQNRLYGSLVEEKSTAFSLSASIGYEYIFTDNRLSLGVAASLHTAFYKKILLSAESYFYLRYRFKALNKED